MNYFILPNGNLLFTVSPQYISKYKDDIENATTTRDLLELSGMLGNGWYDGDGQVGLTSCDIITDHVNEDSELVESSNIWAFLDSYTHSYADKLFADGFLIFTAHEENEDVKPTYPTNVYEAILYTKAMNWNTLEIYDGRIYYDSMHRTYKMFPQAKDAKVSLNVGNPLNAATHINDAKNTYTNCPFIGVQVLEYYNGYYWIGNIISDFYRGEVRTDTDGNRNISDLIFLQTPDMLY